MRKCINCEKDISESHHNRKYCSSTCYNKYRYAKHGQRVSSEKRKEYYKNRIKNRAYREKLRYQGAERYRRVQKFIRDYKLKMGCSDCGYRAHHAALEFDHVRSKKEFNVCFSKSIDQAMKEIKKCEVVCSNCHKIRTFERLQKPKQS